MIVGKRVVLRPLVDPDLQLLTDWGQDPDALFGRYQRFQMDYLQHLFDSYRHHGLISRDAGVLMVEAIEDRREIGVVQYTLKGNPDDDVPHPEIGFGIAARAARGKGYATEAVGLLVDYLFAGYPSERITAFTDVENAPAQRLLSRVGFSREGVMRRATFRSGSFHDVALYGLLREEWRPREGR
jgi:RimJ/RimL family protein N-acetyltransferase